MVARIDGDALALVAGEPAVVVVGAVRQTDALERSFNARSAASQARAILPRRCWGPSVSSHDGQVGKSSVEDHVDAAANSGQETPGPPGHSPMRICPELMYRCR